MNVKTSGTYNSRTTEMDVYIFESAAIDERVDYEDHSTASLFQEL